MSRTESTNGRVMLWLRIRRRCFWPVAATLHQCNAVKLFGGGRVWLGREDHRRAQNSVRRQAKGLDAFHHRACRVFVELFGLVLDLHVAVERLGDSGIRQRRAVHYYAVLAP